MMSFIHHAKQAELSSTTYIVTIQTKKENSWNLELEVTVFSESHFCK